MKTTRLERVLLVVGILALLWVYGSAATPDGRELSPDIGGPYAVWTQTP